MSLSPAAPADTHRVVVLGSGFGGLFATRRLNDAPVRVTLIDRRSHHVFQPLLYQVATGILSQGDVAPATREILRRQRNARVVVGEVVDLDLERRTVTSRLLGKETVTPYDTLIVAVGSAQSYFGHDEFAAHAPGLKTIDDALEVRGRIFGAFEVAELESDEQRRSAWLTFALIGAGATGVEMAGQIAELSRENMAGRYHNIDPTQIRILLLDGAPRILPAFDKRLAARAAAQLERLGVEIETGAMVVGVDAEGIDIRGSDGASRRVATMTKVWSAGVQASSLGRLLAERSRFYAIGQRGRIHLWGRPAWPVWLVVHLVFLTGFKNRAVALFSWIISFFGRTRYESTITLQQVLARRALDAAPPPNTPAHEDE